VEHIGVHVTVTPVAIVYLHD